MVAGCGWWTGDIECWSTGFNKIRLACDRRYGCPLPVIEATNRSVTMRIKASQKYLDLLKNLNGSKENESADYSADNHDETVDLTKKNRQI